MKQITFLPILLCLMGAIPSICYGKKKKYFAEEVTTSRISDEKITNKNNSKSPDKISINVHPKGVTKVIDNSTTKVINNRKVKYMNITTRAETGYFLGSHVSMTGKHDVLLCQIAYLYMHDMKNMSGCPKESLVTMYWKKDQGEEGKKINKGDLSKSLKEYGIRENDIIEFKIKKLDSKDSQKSEEEMGTFKCLIKNTDEEEIGTNLEESEIGNNEIIESLVKKLGEEYSDVISKTVKIKEGGTVQLIIEKTLKKEGHRFNISINHTLMFFFVMVVSATFFLTTKSKQKSKQIFS